jgi:hemerythrin-like metal-binding protein
VDQARAIKALSECGAITAALDTEHDAIENALLALGDAMLAGASPEVLTQIMDMVVDFCTAHFQSEEQAFREDGYVDLEVHAADHKRLLRELRASRAAISDGQIEATIDASVLLNCFLSHVATFDQIAHEELLGQRVKQAGETLRQSKELDRMARALAASGDR